MTATTIDRMMTRRQAAEYLGIREQTLALWASTGRYDLPYVRLGRSVRYRQSDLDRFVAARTITAAAQARSLSSSPSSTPRRVAS